MQESSAWVAKDREVIHRWKEGTKCCQMDLNGGVGKTKMSNVKKGVEDGGYVNGVQVLMVVGCPCSEAAPVDLVTCPGRWASAL